MAKVIMHKTFSYASCINTSQPSDLMYTCNNLRLFSSPSHNLIVHTLIRDSTLHAAPTCSPLFATLTWFIRLGHGDVFATWFHRRGCTDFTRSLRRDSHPCSRSDVISSATFVLHFEEVIMYMIFVVFRFWFKFRIC